MAIPEGRWRGRDGEDHTAGGFSPTSPDTGWRATGGRRPAPRWPRDVPYPRWTDATEEDGGTGTTAPSQASGLTLPELQAIGREAGIDADAVARAARAVTLRGSAAPPAPVGEWEVAHGRTVDAPVSDRAWEAMVAEPSTARS